MKKIFVLALALSFGFGLTPKAEATTEMVTEAATEMTANGGPLWVCKLGFKGYAKGFKILFGNYKFKAAGNLKCISILGKKVRYPVWLTMNALPLSPGVAIGKYKVYGQSAEISLFNCDPDKLLGKYLVAQAHATIIGGVGAISAVKVGLPQLALALSLNVQKGFGFDVSVNQLRITSRGEPQVYPH